MIRKLIAVAALVGLFSVAMGTDAEAAKCCKTKAPKCCKVKAPKCCKVKQPKCCR